MNSISDSWNQIISSLPNPHLLQTREWGLAKQPFGWLSHFKIWQGANGQPEAAAQILQRSISIPGISRSLCMLYIPKGPLLGDWNNKQLRDRVFGDLENFGREQGAFFLKIDPNISMGTGLPGEGDAMANPLGATVMDELRAGGWHFSNEQVQMRNTMLIDLTKSEEQLLADMKQKTRYNLRLAERKGVHVRRGSLADFSSLYAMYAETSVRDGFVIRSEEYYRAVWDSFFKAGILIPLVAEVEHQAVAGLMLFVFGNQSWYLYGMSRNMSRDWMPNYVLQWEAIKAGRAAGCEIYDLWGAPDEFNENDPMWGVYRFKQGLGAYPVRHIGAWDLPLQPVVYSLYTRLLPRLISIMRWRGRSLTRRRLLSGEPG